MLKTFVQLAMPLFACVVLCSCSSSGVLPGRDWTVAHYDRNGDGHVDYTLHDQPRMADEEWALRDSDFDGRYDVREHLGWGGSPSRVDTPVPTGVRITRGPIR